MSITWIENDRSLREHQRPKMVNDTGVTTATEKLAVVNRILTALGGSEGGDLPLADTKKRNSQIPPVLGTIRASRLQWLKSQ